MRRGIEQAKWLLRRIAAELLLVTIAGAVYIVVRKATEGSPAKAFSNARHLAHVEHVLHLDHEHALQGLALQHEWIRNAANWMYIWGHWPAIACVAVGLWYFRHDAYVRLRNAVFASGLIGFVFFAVVPMAPPRLVSTGFVDTVTVWSGSYRVLQPPQYMNIYAAMPSLHFGWDLLVGVTLFLSSSMLILRLVGLAMPLAMWFAVVSTGNHWILDTVAGLLVVLVGAAISETAGAYFAMRRAREATRKRRLSVASALPARSAGASAVRAPSGAAPYREPAN